MFGVKLETYCQDACGDTEFTDNHTTFFLVSRKNLKRAIKEVGIKRMKYSKRRKMAISHDITIREFLSEYTWDWTEQIYLWLYDNNLIIKEWIERSAV